MSQASALSSGQDRSSVSFAGIPITGAAPRLAGRPAALAFFSAFIPVRGQSMAEAMGAESAGYLCATIEQSPDGTIGVDFASFRAMLMQEEPEALLTDVPQALARTALAGGR